MANADVWHWRVTYQDGSTFDEVDPDGREHGWAEVVAVAEGHAGISQIALIPQFPDLAEKIMHVPPGVQPRCFRRRTRQVTVSADGLQTEELPSVTCLALENGQGQGLYLFLWEDGRLLLTDDFQAI